MSSRQTDRFLRRLNRVMIVFDLALGAGALLAPTETLRVIGHERPSDDALHLFRRCGPIWLTFAAGHAAAALCDRREDWWALAWLRATELATDVVWSRSPAISRPGAKAGLRLAGAFNLGAALAFAGLARRALTLDLPLTLDRALTLDLPQHLGGRARGD